MVLLSVTCHSQPAAYPPFLMAETFFCYVGRDPAAISVGHSKSASYKVGFLFLLVLFASLCTMTWCDAPIFPEVHSPRQARLHGCIAVPPGFSTGERLILRDNRTLQQLLAHGHSDGRYAPAARALAIYDDGLPNTTGRGPYPLDRAQKSMRACTCVTSIPHD